MLVNPGRSPEPEKDSSPEQHVPCPSLHKSLEYTELDGPVLHKAQDVRTSREGVWAAGAAMVREDVALARVEAPTHVGTVQGFLWSSLPPGFRVLPQ